MFWGLSRSTAENLKKWQLRFKMNWDIISSYRKRAGGQRYQPILVFTPPCPPTPTCLYLPGSGGGTALPFSILVQEEWQPLIKAEGQFKPPYVLVSQFPCGFIFTQPLPAPLSPPKRKTHSLSSPNLFWWPWPHFSPCSLRVTLHQFPLLSPATVLLRESFSHLTNRLLVSCPKSKQNQIQDNTIVPPKSNFLKHLSALPHQNGETYHQNVFIVLHLFPDLSVKAESPPPHHFHSCV